MRKTSVLRFAPFSWSKENEIESFVRVEWCCTLQDKPGHIGR